MKKLFPEDKDRKKSIRDFIDKKGFYIVLLLCIAIVGGTAIYVTTRNAISNAPEYDARNIIPENEETDALAKSNTSLNAQEPIGTAAIAQADKKVASNDTAKAEPTKIEAKPTATPKSSSEEGNIKTSKSIGTAAKAANAEAKAHSAIQEFEMPVMGDVTFEYAKDKLVYSKTLEEWRSHEGVDLAADRGTPVKAAADGVVSEIKNDPRFGIVVIIDHKNGIKTVYSNLASDESVTPNQKVKQGEVIGSIGNTAAFESVEQSHLHFEVLKDDVTTDPMIYLPENKSSDKN